MGQNVTASDVLKLEIQGFFHPNWAKKPFVLYEPEELELWAFEHIPQ